MSSTLDELQQARYVSLATLRRSGVAVATPVWCAFENGAGYVFSAADAGKVKRLRVSPRARLAVCDVRGRLLGGWHEASAEIVSEPAEIARALRSLHRKYGWQMWLADAGSKLTGRFGRRAYIRVRIVQTEAPSS
ncbi:MAG: PPOX class F420-dependent oxidoreductase [Pseudomonadales bacterium]